MSASPIIRQSTTLTVPGTAWTSGTMVMPAWGTPTLNLSRIVVEVGICNNQNNGISCAFAAGTAYETVGTALRQSSGNDAVSTTAFQLPNSGGTVPAGTVTFTGLPGTGVYVWAIAHEVTGDDPAADLDVAFVAGVGSGTAFTIGPTLNTTQPGVLMIGAVTTPNIQLASVAVGSLFAQVAAGSSGGTGNSVKVAGLVAQQQMAAAAIAQMDVTVSTLRQYAGVILSVPSPDVTGGGGGGAAQQFPLGPPDMTGATTIPDPGIATPSALAKRWTPKLSNTVDYILDAPLQRGGPISIVGGRNVYVPKLLIKIAGPGMNEMVGIAGGAAGRIVHLENVHLNPNGFECDAFKTLTPGDGRILQIKTCRVEELFGHNSGTHADLVQTSGGLGDLWVQDFTGYTNYDGFMMQREANVEQQTTSFSITAGTVNGSNYIMTAPNHTLVAGNPVAMWGITPAAYNGGYTVLSVAGSGTAKTFTVKHGDPTPGTVTAHGHVCKQSFAYNVGSINFLRVNVKGFPNLTGVPTEALQAIRFGARTAPTPNAGNPGTVLPSFDGHANEDQTPLTIDQWSGTLTATDWYAQPNSGLVGNFVEPDAGTVNYSVIRPVDHAASGTVPAYCAWPSHPNVSGRLNAGTPPNGDFVIIQGGVPVTTAAGTAAAPSAPVNTSLPTILPVDPLVGDSLTVGSIGGWTGTDSTTLYTVNFARRLGTSGVYTVVQTQSGLDAASALLQTYTAVDLDNGYQFQVQIIADNGNASSTVGSLPTNQVLAPLTITLVVEVE